MKRIIVTAVLALIVPAGSVFADEIIIHRDSPDVVDVPPPPPRDVVIEHRRPDCATTTVHRENGLGDSSTTTRRECD